MMKLISYTDGGSRNNPGPAACGLVLQDELGNVVHQAGQYIGTATNNEAEYQALLLALEKAKELGAGEVRCHLDSELVVKQLNRQYKVKDEKMKALFARVNQACLAFDKVEFVHVRREQNKLADKLVNEALDQAGF